MSSAKVDTRKANRLISALSGKEMKEVKINALLNSARILQKETDAQFKRKINIDGLRVKYKNKKGKEKTKWLRVATVRIDRKKTLAKVHIMADFRAKFFELGTRPRRTKGHKITGSYMDGKRKYLTRSGKGGYRGRITAGYYFKRAQSVTEHMIFSNMDKEMSKAILKIAAKYGHA